MDVAALILAPLPADERIVTGLRLGERARRVAVKAGVAPARVHVARSSEELAQIASALAGAPLVVIRATGWVIGVPLVTPLEVAHPGSRVAMQDGAYAGALRADPADASAVLAALAADFAAGDATAAAGFAPVAVGRRARHPARTREEVRAADAWQFELTHKALDGFLPAFYQRPLARPFTRMFLRLPFTPNQISILSGAISLTGCVLTGFASWQIHVLGLAVLVFGGIIDACDGEVARLRMQESKLGAWLDAMGDDVARIALIIGMGHHVAWAYPSWPIFEVTLATLALTLTAMGLIYWYCFVVVGSVSNQDYEAVLGVGGNVPVDGKKSWKRLIGDAGTTMARRVFIDPAILILALLGVSWIGFAGLAAGSVVSLAIIFPAHLRIVQSRRARREAEVT
jgi:phosphatidylglycerophosphate synthase